MPYVALWCDLHRVDVWELLPLPRVAQFFHSENSSKIIDEGVGSGYAESDETGRYDSCGLSWQDSYTCGLASRACRARLAGLTHLHGLEQITH